jgi:hypothetical protein
MPAPVTQICSPVQKPTEPTKFGIRLARHPGVGSAPRGESPGAYSDPGNPKRREARADKK